MYRVGFPFPGIANGTRVYSPVTLSREWPTLSRLIFIVFWSFLGSIINGFFVASFFVEHALKRLGKFTGIQSMTSLNELQRVAKFSSTTHLIPVCYLLE